MKIKAMPNQCDKDMIELWSEKSLLIAVCHIDNFEGEIYEE